MGLAGEGESFDGPGRGGHLGIRLGDGDGDRLGRHVVVVIVAHHLVIHGVLARVDAGGDGFGVLTVLAQAVLHGAAGGAARRHQRLVSTVIGEGFGLGGGHLGVGPGDGEVAGGGRLVPIGDGDGLAVVLGGGQFRAVFRAGGDAAVLAPDDVLRIGTAHIVHCDDQIGQIQRLAGGVGHFFGLGLDADARHIPHHSEGQLAGSFCGIGAVAGIYRGDFVFTDFQIAGGIGSLALIV